MLKLGTKNCPVDKTQLHFELIAGMRIKHNRGDGYIFNARCPYCGRHFTVNAPKD